MKIHRVHRWENITVAEAQSLQKQLAEQIVLEGNPSEKQVRKIAGADMAFSRKHNLAFGVVAIYSFPDFEILEIQRGVKKIDFPYVPGFLSFREAPLLLDLFENLRNIPDIVMIDGQGIAHPRRLGLAAHIGLFLQIPTIGVAKSRLFGKYTEPGPSKGDWSWLWNGDEKIGVVLRTRDNVKPVFVSPGNMISLEGARDWALKCAIKYRIPEPTRIADKLVGQFKQTFISKLRKA